MTIAKACPRLIVFCETCTVPNEDSHIASTGHDLSSVSLVAYFSMTTFIACAKAVKRWGIL